MGASVLPHDGSESVHPKLRDSDHRTSPYLSFHTSSHLQPSICETPSEPLSAHPLQSSVPRQLIGSISAIVAEIFALICWVTARHRFDQNDGPGRATYGAALWLGLVGAITGFIRCVPMGPAVSSLSSTA